MAGNTSITSGDYFKVFIGRQIAAGRYRAASEVVRASLRFLEEHEQRVAAPRQALADGAASGDAGPLDFEEIRRAAKRQIDDSETKRPD